MTYNVSFECSILHLLLILLQGILIGAVILGAGLGHYIFEREIQIIPSNEHTSFTCHL